MDTPLLGLHHVTAVTGKAKNNAAFYTQTLGMRLVKKTVNQDDVSAYHLFYADAQARPGTDLTFFDWPQAAPNRPGTGTVSATGLRVPDAAALQWWAEYLTNHGVAHGGVQDRAGRAMLAFTDPEGQRLQLVEDGHLPYGEAWAGGPVPPEVGIRGLDSVVLTVRDAAPTARVLTDILGFREGDRYQSAEGRPVTIYGTGPGGPGSEVHLEERSDGVRGQVGRGGVHHIALRTPDDDQHRQWQQRLTDLRVPNSGVVDRFYFRSLYFREPGGILFEIATDGPGFATDEDPAHLGERLALPPFLEPRRAQIEAGLTPLRLPHVNPAN